VKLVITLEAERYGGILEGLQWALEHLSAVEHSCNAQGHMGGYGAGALGGAKGKIVTLDLKPKDEHTHREVL
jgi:hypothetical protein